MIAETDASTGTTLREYVWLGLTPIASYGAANDNGPPPDGEPCDENAITALQALLTEAQAELLGLQSDLAEHEDSRVFRLARIAQMHVRAYRLPNSEKNIDIFRILAGRLGDLDISHSSRLNVAASFISLVLNTGENTTDDMSACGIILTETFSAFDNSEIQNHVLLMQNKLQGNALIYFENWTIGHFLRAIA